MKQFIEQSQYDGLSEQAKQKWLTWTFAKSDITHDYSIAYRSIGHLIWFLDENMPYGWIQIKRDSEKTEWLVDHKYLELDEEGKPELIDALWEAVKAVLENEEQP